MTNPYENGAGSQDENPEIHPAGNISSILFACNINAVRSAMAEALIKHRFPGQIFTDSCGVALEIKMALPLLSCRNLILT